MDPDLDVLYGPSPIQKTGTVSIPRELLRESGMDPGDRVHWALNPDLPGTLLVIPAKMVARTMPAILREISQG
ncbi:MAG: hypothetical protein M0Z30_05685 [Actinomycetota bacterium]|nr:hypothetical protein [Actinomycetota bacterium]